MSRLNQIIDDCQEIPAFKRERKGSLTAEEARAQVGQALSESEQARAESEEARLAAEARVGKMEAKLAR